MRFGIVFLFNLKTLELFVIANSLTTTESRNTKNQGLSADIFCHRVPPQGQYFFKLLSIKIHTKADNTTTYEDREKTSIDLESPECYNFLICV